MSAVKLPRSIEEKLTELAHHVRRVWLLRGLSWFILLFLASAAAMVLLDTQLALPSAGRYTLLGLWGVLQVLAFRKLVLRPMRDELPMAMVAAAVEVQFPNLAERLTTLVELSEHADAGNGSRALIEVLARETAQRAKKLDFDQAAPTGSLVRAALLALLVTVVVLLPLFLMPEARERLRKFLVPSFSLSSAAKYKLEVSSKDVVAKRGEAVTLTAFLERLQPDAVLPETATLVYLEGDDGPEQKLPMTGDEKATFHVTRPTVDTSFRYRIEAGEAVSPIYTVTIVMPVELGEGTRFTISPPKYADGIREIQEQQGLHEFEALQYSRVKFNLKFSRPAAAATFEWKPANTNGQIAAEQFFVQLTEDRMSGSAEWMLIGDGTLKLALTGERKTVTEITVNTKAKLDTPPKFEKVSGVGETVRDVRPGDRLPIELLVVDDLKVDKLELEYAVNGDATTKRTLPMPIKDVGTPRAEGRFSFDLKEIAKEGDTVKFRIRATDNRNVPEFSIAPQTTEYPEKHWAELKITSMAKPLAEQEVEALKKKLKDRLRLAIEEVTLAREDVAGVKRLAPNIDQLTPELIAKLDNAKGKAQEASRILDDLAASVGLTEDLRPFANTIRSVADDTLRQADAQLRKSTNEAAKEPRNQAINQAHAKLDEAKDKLEELINKVDAVGQNLLDKKKLEELADRQKELADELKKDPDNERHTRPILKKQQELNAELEDLLKRNETLRNAAEQMARDNARDLANEAEELQKRQKQLDDDIRENDLAAQRQARQQVTEKQKALNQKANELRKNTENDAKVAGTDELKQEPFANAAEQLDKGNTVEAMTEQEKAARELDRLAAALESAVRDRKDPKKAAEQLAKLEAELRKQAAESKELTDELKKQRQQQQEAVRKATEKLSTPPGDDDAAKAKQDAIDALKNAEAAAGGNDPVAAEHAMQDAAQALEGLAEKLPTREQRLKAAAEELQRLQREQDELQREVNEQLKTEKKNTDPKELKDKLANAAKKQSEIADKLEQLDTPGLEKRKQRTTDAARDAAKDLQNGLAQDAPASQGQAARQQEQLRQAMEGRKPNDERLDELAKKQRQLANEAEKLSAKPDPMQLQRLAEQERELSKQLREIQDPHAAEQLNRAKDTVRHAEQAAEKNDVDELKKKSHDAAEQLDRLADLTAGAESDQEAAERLAKKRETAADKAQQQTGKPTTPDETNEAKDQLQRDAEDLKQLRAGEAQDAKKKAADALEKLLRNPTPERAPKLQKESAEAMRKLADQMAKKGEHNDKDPRGDPDANAGADDAEGNLPSPKDAQQARELAKQQRANRDATAKSNDATAKPQDPKASEKLAQEQQKLANDAKQLGDEGEDAANAAQDAADQLKKGETKQGEAAGQKAQQELEKLGEKGQALAKKQQQLNEQMKQHQGNQHQAQQEQQQQAQQKNLAKKAGELAEKLEEAAKDPGDADPMKLKQAAEQAREAQKQMERAEREEQAGRKQNADDGRKKAEQALDKANEQAQEAAGDKRGDKPSEKPGDKPGENSGAKGGGKSGEQPGEKGGDKPGNQPGKQAGKNAKQAEQLMDKAEQDLKQKQGQAAGEKMDQAAKKLDDAAKELNKSAQGEGKGDGNGNAPGTGDGGMNPGGNSGAGTGPPNAGNVPPDVQQYLGKPWGELPGDVKTKIIQDLQAKYGEDYARVIKLYFEQLAERK